MADPLPDDEVADRLPAGWDRDGDEIVRTFEFDEYLAGLAFAQIVAEIAETRSHHPTMVVGHGEVEVRFTTHEAGGVTDDDIELAGFVDAEY